MRNKTKTASSRLFITILCILILIGCKKPKESDLVGSWIIENYSREYLPREFKNMSCEIILNDDLTFKAKKVPIELFGDKKQTAGDGQGSWNFMQLSKEKMLNLKFSNLMIEGKNVGAYSLIISFSSNSLYYFVGDPDNGEMIEFRRK